MSSTEDYLESLLANAVNKSKDSKVRSNNGQNRTSISSSSGRKGGARNGARNTAFSDAESELDSLLGKYSGSEHSDESLKEQDYVKNDYSEEEYRQPLELEEGGKLSLDDTLPEEFIVEPEPYINEKSQELDDKLVLDSRIPSEYLGDEEAVYEETKLEAQKYQETNDMAQFETKRDTADRIADDIIADSKVSESKVTESKDTESRASESKVTFEEFNPSSEFESFLAGFDEEEIEKRLAEAADVSDVKTKHFDDEADITDILSSISESGNDSMDDIGEMLKASDDNVILDTSYLDKLEDPANYEDSSEDEVLDSKSDKKDKKKNKNKGKLFDKIGSIFGKKNKKQKVTDVDNDDQIGDDDMEHDRSDNQNIDGNNNDKNIEGNIEMAIEGHGVTDDNVDTQDGFGGNANADDNDSDIADLFDFSSDESEGEQDSKEESVEENDTMAGAGSNEASSDEEDDDNQSDASEDDTSDGKKKKKKGLFSKILDLLTEEEEEPEAAALENSNLVSDENKAILEELDAEEDGKKGKKGKKKDKKAKKEKAPKEKKPKKPKKEKKPKEKEEADPRKKIPKQFIVMTFALALSCLAILMLVVLLIPKMNNLSNARKSFYAKDYKDTFVSMYGKKLSDSDKLLYERAKILVLLDRKYESYETYKAMGMRMQALDALLKGVSKYMQLKPDAEIYDISNELDIIYAKIKNELMNEFGVSEDEALDIITYSPLDYTLKLQSILDGTPYTKKSEEINASYGFGTVTENENIEPEQEEKNFPDMLPEEENINISPIEDEGSFMENHPVNSQDNPAEIIIESEQF